MRKFILALGLLLAATVTAGTQSTPGFRQGQVPTAAQWNAAFGAKQDYLGSLTAVPLNSGNIFYGVSNVAVSMLPTQAFDATFCATRGALLSRQVASWACLGVGTAGQALISGGAGADPAFGAIGVAGGGTGATTLTAHGMLIGQGTSAITSLPCAVNQVMQWPTGTGADPTCTSTPLFGANGGTGGTLRLNGSTSGTATISVAAAAGTVTFQLPATNGASTNYLSTNGSGTTSWATLPSTVTFQYLTSGSGATYTTPAGARAILAKFCGGGGGGGASATNNGGTGGTTTFNSVNAVGGGGGIQGGTAGRDGGAGGTGGTGTATFRVAGSIGGLGNNSAGVTGAGNGASGLFGSGAGGGGIQGGGNGRNGATNSCAGGGGGQAGGGAGAGGGGGGEYAELYIASPAATYTYTVGAAGTGGAAGGSSGGNGGTAMIIVSEYY